MVVGRRLAPWVGDETPDRQAEHGVQRSSACPETSSQPGSHQQRTVAQETPAKGASPQEATFLLQAPAQPSFIPEEAPPSKPVRGTMSLKRKAVGVSASAMMFPITVSHVVGKREKLRSPTVGSW